MQREDLPEGYGGWQVLDATPQEMSSGTILMCKKMTQYAFLMMVIILSTLACHSCLLNLEAS